MARVYRKPKRWRGKTLVIGDPLPQERKRRSEPRKIHNYALQRRSKPTSAERELEQILNGLNHGVLRGQFLREWECGNWILDFFFPKNRLGIEVDGGYHASPEQKQKDKQKEEHCRRVEITLLRITNHDVFGNREILIEKLRSAYRRANEHMKTFVAEFEAKKLKRLPEAKSKTPGASASQPAARIPSVKFPEIYDLPEVGFVIYDKGAQGSLPDSRIRLWKVRERKMATFDKAIFKKTRIACAHAIQGKPLQRGFEKALVAYNRWRSARRETNCYACQRSLVSYGYNICKECGWINCKCGNCGCNYRPRINTR